MNSKQIKEMLPVLQAFADGKQIQFRHKGKDWRDGDSFGFYEDADYRIKPQPTLRPWKPEEVPIGALIRGSCYGVRVILGYGRTATGVHDYVLYVGGESNVTGDGLQVCFECREHSLDLGVTWLPCGVME